MSALKPNDYTDDQIKTFKSVAHRNKKQQGIPQPQALDGVAQGLGYKTWALLMIARKLK